MAKRLNFLTVRCFGVNANARTVNRSKICPVTCDVAPKSSYLSFFLIQVPS